VTLGFPPEFGELLIPTSVIPRLVLRAAALPIVDTVVAVVAVVAHESTVLRTVTYRRGANTASVSLRCRTSDGCDRILCVVGTEWCSAPYMEVRTDSASWDLSVVHVVGGFVSCMCVLGY